jgi:antitoxin (DNA-binding transcriptional repressor) of toxin-antitoxin stability system
MEQHPVSLWKLRHHLSQVMARIRHGEIIDITEDGRLIARIIPAGDRKPAPVLDRLVASGRATPAQRPGYRPRPDLDALVTCDSRLASAATDAGLAVLAPAG